VITASRAAYAEQSALWAADQAQVRAVATTAQEGVRRLTPRLPQAHVRSAQETAAALQSALDARAAASAASVVSFRQTAPDAAAMDEPESSSSDDEPAAPKKRGPRPVCFVAAGSRSTITPRRMARVDNVPKYTTWIMTTENTHVQARRDARSQRHSPAAPLTLRAAQEEVQRRLLYADKEGEMVPGTDSDADEMVRGFTAVHSALSADARATPGGRSGRAASMAAAGGRPDARRGGAAGQQPSASHARLTHTAARLA
jgi:hypothetical protein